MKLSASLLPLLGGALLSGALLASTGDTGLNGSLPIVATAGSGVSAKECVNCPKMVPVEVSIDERHYVLMVARHELTWKEYLQSFDEARCPSPMNHRPDNDEAVEPLPQFRDDYPMTAIYPSQIGCYLKWLSDKTGKSYRLPTSREWTAIAARGTGSTTIMPPAVSELDERLSDVPLKHARAAGEIRDVVRWGQVDKVAHRRPNRLGLYDVLGNVSEVVSDKVPPRDGIKLVMIKGGDLTATPTDDLISGHYLIPSESIYSLAGYRVVYEVEQGSE